MDFILLAKKGNIIVGKFSTFFKKNYLILLVAFAVGLISILPDFLAITRLGADYLGIPFIFQANADVYLARIREVVDGHGTVGSAFFYEYKDWSPLVPSIGEYLYALPTLLFSIPLLSVLLASKFVLPALLFVLVYCLILRLSSDPASLSARVNAVVGGLLVTLGYDLVDYRSVIKLVQDPAVTVLSVWTRPVNPIIGAVLIFSFLLLAWAVVTTRKKYLFIPTGLVWALTIGYVFSWTFLLVIVGLFILFYGYRKDWHLVKIFLLTILIWFLATLPYWYTTFNSFASLNGKKIVAKSGLVFTHAPVFNKLLFFCTLIFIASSVYFKYCKKNKEADDRWWWFCLSLLATSWIVFNQQIITGRSIWYHHYVQYIIPVLMVVAMVLLNNWIKPCVFKVWTFIITTMVVLILVYNAFALGTIRNYQVYFKQLQNFAPVFAWINNNTFSDCVILNQDVVNVNLNSFIPAFTHCNVYTSSWVFDGVPEERVWHNYLVTLRLRNINPTEVKSYLENHTNEVLSNFFYNWDQLSDVGDNGYTQKKIDQLIADYQEFFKKDFVTELKKYKLDYILFVGKPNPTILRQLPHIKLIFNDDDYYIYRF